MTEKIPQPAPDAQEPGGETAPVTVASIERAYPSWMVWTVPTFDGHTRGLIWCARRWDGQGEALSAHTAKDLVEYLTEAAQ